MVAAGVKGAKLVVEVAPACSWLSDRWWSWKICWWRTSLAFWPWGYSGGVFWQTRWPTTRMLAVFIVSFTVREAYIADTSSVFATWMAPIKLLAPCLGTIPVEMFPILPAYHTIQETKILARRHDLISRADDSTHEVRRTGFAVPMRLAWRRWMISSVDQSPPLATAPSRATSDRPSQCRVIHQSIHLATQVFVGCLLWLTSASMNGQGGPFSIAWIAHLPLRRCRDQTAWNSNVSWLQCAWSARPSWHANVRINNPGQREPFIQFIPGTGRAAELEIPFDVITVGSPRFFWTPYLVRSTSSMNV